MSDDYSSAWDSLAKTIGAAKGKSSGYFDDLDPDVVYVEGQSLGFVRTGLSQPDRQWSAEWLVAAALDELLSPAN